MSDLVEFLLARITEDEAEAPLALGPCDCDVEGFPLQHGIRCIERFMAEREATRRIAVIESRWRRTKDTVDTVITSSGPGYDGLTRVTTQPDPRRPLVEETVTSEEFRQRFTEPSPPSEALKLLALPYADHPDYREEWRP